MGSRKRRHSTLVTTILLTATLTIGQAGRASAEPDPQGVPNAPNVVIQWDTAGLDAVSKSTMGPPMVARALAVLHTCIYDAWAAYDSRAAGTRFGIGLRRPAGEHTVENKSEAISYAAYTAAVDMWPEYKSDFDILMARLGYPTTGSTTASDVGVRACTAVLDYRHRDGSNQLGELGGEAYSDYTGYKPANRPMRIDKPMAPGTVRDPNRWQPLVFDNDHDFVTQTNVGPHWRNVKSFAMQSWDQFTGTLSEPARYGSDRYLRQAEEIVDYSANLTDEQKVITEFWADDFQGTVRPPGRWLVIGQFISNRDNHTIDDDAKMFFAISNAVFDSSIACWGVKVKYDSVRPITAIRYLYWNKQIPSWSRADGGPQMINGAIWTPYQPEWLMTPAFGDYVSDTARSAPRPRRC